MSPDADLPLELLLVAGLLLVDEDPLVHALTNNMPPTAVHNATIERVRRPRLPDAPEMDHV